MIIGILIGANRYLIRSIDSRSTDTSPELSPGSVTTEQVPMTKQTKASPRNSTRGSETIAFREAPGKSLAPVTSTAPSSATYGA